MRSALENRCPLCGQDLKDHSVAAVACSLLKDTDEATMRAALIAGPLDALPLEPLNDATFDALTYMLLKCPNRGAYAVLRRFSGADLYSEDSATVTPGIPSQRLEQLINHVPEWHAL